MNRLSLCILCVLCASVVSGSRLLFTTETRRTQSTHRDLFAISPQGPELDYSSFKHTSHSLALLVMSAKTILQRQFFPDTKPASVVTLDSL